jgi:hypothetical protein
LGPPSTEERRNQFAWAHHWTHAGDRIYVMRDGPIRVYDWDGQHLADWTPDETELQLYDTAIHGRFQRRWSHQRQKQFMSSFDIPWRFGTFPIQIDGHEYLIATWQTQTSDQFVYISQLFDQQGVIRHTWRWETDAYPVAPRPQNGIWILEGDEQGQRLRAIPWPLPDHEPNCL